MAHVKEHAPGAFSWIELGTSDQNAAKTFYTSLFGWNFEDSPMGPNDFYTMFKLEGENSGAAYTLRPEQAQMHVPPHWNLYVSVESADKTAKKAEELGAQVLVQPFDVYTFGRMAVIKDPTGAVFSIWEPKEHIGLGVKDQSGSFCWADLNTPDVANASKFYSGLFGWTLEEGANGYVHIKNNDTYIGGMPPAQFSDPNIPPHWLIYIAVDDCNASTSKAKQLGAKICMGPTPIENVGSMTVLADPQNAAFALFEPARKPA